MVGIAFFLLIFFENIMNSLLSYHLQKKPLSPDEIHNKLRQFDQIISGLQEKIQKESDPHLVKAEFNSLVFDTLIPMIRELDDSAYSTNQDEYIDLKRGIQEITPERFLKGNLINNNNLMNLIAQILSCVTGRTHEFFQSNLTLGQKDYLRELGLLRERYIKALWVSWERLKKYDEQKIVAAYNDELFSWLSSSSLDTER